MEKRVLAGRGRRVLVVAIRVFCGVGIRFIVVEQALTLRRGARRILFIGGWGNGRLRAWFGSGLGFGLATHCCRWVELVGL